MNELYILKLMELMNYDSNEESNVLIYQFFSFFCANQYFPIRFWKSMILYQYQYNKDGDIYSKFLKNISDFLILILFQALKKFHKVFFLAQASVLIHMLSYYFCLY